MLIQKNDYGKTPLHIVSENGHINIVEYLTKECKCNVNTKE